MKTLGFLGKTEITKVEEENLLLLGRVIARAPRELVTIQGNKAISVTAVEMGVGMEEGQVRRIERGVLTESAHSLIYADARLLTRLRQAYPTFDQMKNLFVMSNNLELTMFIHQCRLLLGKWGIPFPE